MRKAALRTVKALRITVLLALLLTLACIGAWYGAQLLRGNDARAELESLWHDSGEAPAPPSFNPGDVVGRIVVPRIGLDAPLVEMADVDDRENLNKGPAHLAGSACPGQAGNCVISGHRTTYTRPFFSLDAMREGDEVILIDLTRSSYTYRVSQVLIVEPQDVWVMDPTPEPSVTLIACHPLFSARNRIVVKAVLEE
ncbi:MAG: class E sortase [Actinomycetota bacterium]|nr:class E sortase [Actinomycetota bacterium]MDD5667257.1 class E sortase [Actinomycetota bacterium]